MPARTPSEGDTRYQPFCWAPVPGIVRTRALVRRRWATLPSVLFAFYLVLLLAVVALVVLLVRGAGRAVGRAIRADQMGRGAKTRLLASVLAAALVVGFVAWLAAFLRDPVVTVRGTDYFCTSAPIGEDPFPADVQEQCDGQGHDRRMQALASGAAASGAAAVVMLLAVRVAPTTITYITPAQQRRASDADDR